MHVSNKCSIAIHCLIFIHEYGTENKVTSELLSLSTGCQSGDNQGYSQCAEKKRCSVCEVRYWRCDSCSRTRRYNTLSDLYSSGTGCH